MSTSTVRTDSHVVHTLHQPYRKKELHCVLIGTRTTRALFRVTSYFTSRRMLSNSQKIRGEIVRERYNMMTRETSDEYPEGLDRTTPCN